MKRSKASAPKFLSHLELIEWAGSIKRSDDNSQLWDPVRKKWLTALPEELVRLALVHFLNEDVGVSLRRMSVERKVSAQNLRFDLVVYDKQGSPHLLIECKRPDEQLKLDHFIQLDRYNQDINAPFVLITNGRTSICIDLNSGHFLESLSECFSNYL